MQIEFADIPPALAGALTEALRLCPTGTDPEAALLLIGSEDPEQALARIADFAALHPVPVPVGTDLRASGQVIWLLPAGTVATLSGVLHRAALAHAPQLRVNAIHLGPRRPKPAPWQAAWHAAQPHPGPEELQKVLCKALGFLLQVPSVTGQLVNVNVSL